MKTTAEIPKIKVSVEELKFMKDNAPKAFASSISEALLKEGYEVSRVKVHQELTTLKDTYDPRIIEAARRVLLFFRGVKFEDK
jgi:hypothetical protein